MSEEEEEYEVENVTKARVEKAAGRKKDLIWKYNVRWRGYGPSDDTWEPVSSFVGSEHIIEGFWERANIGDRDYHDLSLFKAGEEFVLTGPPRRKLKRTSSKPNTLPGPMLVPALTSDKRKRSPSVIAIDDSDDGRPPKRVRETDIPSSHKKYHMPSPKRGQNQDSVARETLRTTAAQYHPPIPSRPARASSLDEIIPPSDDEELSQPKASPLSTLPVDADILETFGGNDDHASDTVVHPVPDVDMAQDAASSQDELSLVNPPVWRRASGDRLPFHRVMAANPKVKMVDLAQITTGMEGGISVKSRLLGHTGVASTSPTDSPRATSSRNKHPSGSKPGPGRSSSGFMRKNTSSLLTFEKGGLKTLKGTYRKEAEKPVEVSESHDSTPSGSLFGGYEEQLDSDSPGLATAAPPTAEELLRLAGAEPEDVLPDFDDDLIVPSPPLGPATVRLAPATVVEHLADQTQSTLQQSLAIAKDKLFPSSTKSVINTLSAAWKRSTIFGPLGLASESQAPQQAATSESTPSSPFFLNLDTSASTPVLLADASPSSPGSPSLEIIVTNKGPPGKFYSEKTALALLDTVRTGGPSARIVLDTGATLDQKSQFELFQSRLDSGELFVAMAGVEVLVFCSSDNVLLSQRLNVSPMLLTQRGAVLVARVVIENYSAYADAALDADGGRWRWAE